MKLPTTLLCLLVIAGNAPSQSISTPTEWKQQPFDVKHYSAVIDLSGYTTKQISAVCNIECSWVESSNNPEVLFHLRGLTVDSVKANGARVEFAQRGTPKSDTFHYAVKLGLPVSKDEFDTISVYYHGTMSNEGGGQPWGGVHYEDQVLYALGVGFANNYVSSTQHWLACYDHPSDKATADIYFIVPTTAMVASNGLLTSVTLHTDPDKHIVHWREKDPCATYLLTFAAGPLVTTKGNTGSAKDVPFEFYTLARDTNSSRISYSLVPEMVRAFESLYGDYPFSKVGYVNTQRGAMEHQTMISFPVSLAQRRDTVNSTAAHELAHQWFGDCVSPLTFADAWLTEAFATYSEQAWAEHLFGTDAYLNAVQANVAKYVNQTSKREGILPLHNFPREAPSSNYPVTIYQKGAVVVSMMRSLCGDSAFYQTMKKYMQMYAYGNATTSTMLDVMREGLGDRTDAFFNDWIYGKGWPTLKVETIDGFAGTIVYVFQTQSEKFNVIPLGVRYPHQFDTRIVDTLFVLANDTLTFTTSDFSRTFINVGSSHRSLIEVQNPTSVKNQLPVEERVIHGVDVACTKLFIEIKDQTSDARVVITDLRGRTMQDTTVPNSNAQFSIPIGYLASGDYVASIQMLGEIIPVMFTVRR